MASSDEIKKLKENVAAAKAEMDTLLQGLNAQDRAAMKLDARYKAQVTILKESNEQLKEIQSQTKIIVDTLIQQESKLKGLTGIQASLVELDRKRLKSQKTLGSVTQDSINSVASATQELLSMSAEDEISRAKKLADINDQIELLRENEEVNQDIINTLEQQRDIAERMSLLTEKQQGYLDKQLKVYESIKDTVGGIFDTADLLLSTGLGKLGAVFIAGGAAGKKLLETSRQLGSSLLDTSNISTTLFSTIFPNAVETTKSLSKEFGGLSDVSALTQFRTNALATNLGISASEAAGLTGSFARLNDGSAKTAQNLIQSTKNLAEQNGLVPADVMADVANSAEQFALFGKNGGKNIAEAAIAASKLGVSMQQVSGIADNLLDFENSINAELELGAMLGRNINLDRARALAYEGDIGGAVRETLSSLGGIEEFNKMDYFQKKQTAALLGVSVAEFQKMADNADKLGKNGEITVTNYEKFANTAKSVGSYLFSGMQAMGSMAIAAGQMGINLKSSGGILQKFKSYFSKSAPTGPLKKDGTPDMRFKSNKTAPMKSLSDKANPASKGGLMQSLGKINMNAVLKGAAAMVIVAGAVFVFGKAVQEFMKVSWEAVGMAVVSMLSLVGAVALLGAIMTSPVGAIAILAGAAAMLVIAASVLVLGYALQEIGTGFEMMSTGIGSLMPQLMSVATTIGNLVLLIPAIGLLAYSLMGLSASLMALGVAGVLAAPGLMALSAVGTVATGLNSLLGGDGGGGEDRELLTEIQGLRNDLTNGKVAVYMDGQKVASTLSKVYDKIGSNSYAV
jgi:hypothetical protein